MIAIKYRLRNKINNIIQSYKIKVISYVYKVKKLKLIKLFKTFQCKIKKT